MIKQNVILLISVLLLVKANAQMKFEKVENGIYYTIKRSANAKSKPLIKKGEKVAFSLVQKFGDSIAYNTNDAGHQVLVADGIKKYLDFRYLFNKLKVGDSLFIGISVDTIYQQQLRTAKQNDPNFNEVAFKANVPAFFLKPDNLVCMDIKVLDKYVTNKKDVKCAADTKRATQFLKKQTAKQTAYEQKMQKEAMAKMETAAQGNIKIGQQFLAANKKNANVIETASGLQYQIITQGNGAKPSLSNTVVCHYKGTLINGNEFDNSYSRGEPLEFGVQGVIKGWTEVLQLMPIGSKYKVWIPSELGYGNMGAGDAIGPGETLIFEIELINIK
jgi:FKBP-type peptidyl-prolyl cis-trans isomerase FklB